VVWKFEVAGFLFFSQLLLQLVPHNAGSHTSTVVVACATAMETCPGLKPLFNTLNQPAKIMEFDFLTAIISTYSYSSAGLGWDIIYIRFTP